MHLTFVLKLTVTRRGCQNPPGGVTPERGCSSFKDTWSSMLCGCCEGQVTLSSLTSSFFLLAVTPLDALGPRVPSRAPLISRRGLSPCHSSPSWTSGPRWSPATNASLYSFAVQPKWLPPCGLLARHRQRQRESMQAPGRFYAGGWL